MSRTDWPQGPTITAMLFDTILVGYRLNHTLEALDVCNRIHGRKKGSRRVLVLNDAKIAGALDARAARWEIVHGSNRLGEFSGWQEGLDHIGRTGRGVFFANDSITVHRKFTSARRHALKKSLKHADGAVMIGFRDQGKGVLAVDGLPLQSWVRTYCFGLSAEALALLRYLICDASIAEKCVPGGLDEGKFFAHLSPDLTARLRHNLFGGGWYASEPLSATSVARLSFKARCIVLEKWLAARCAASSIDIADPFERYRLIGEFDKAQSRPLVQALSGLARTLFRRFRESA